jgi:hypothetical protein
MAKFKLLTLNEFTALLPKLRQRLLDGLTKELKDCALPDPDTDLWDIPPVDSKTVVKLAPIIKDLIGHRLDPRWIRKGGYDSIAEAAADLIAQIRAHCVVGGAAVSPSKPLPVTLAS